MFFITKAHGFCIFVVIRGEGQSLESLLAPNSPVVYTTGETVLDKFTGCEVVFTAGKNAALDGINGRQVVKILGNYVKIT